MDKLMEPLSSTDILKALNGKVKIITSDQLYKFDSIDELLEPYNKVVILYIWKVKPCYGHFTCLSKRGDTIDYFDSFGKSIDSVNKELSYEFKSQNHLTYPYLTKLLYDSPYNIEFNENPIQDMKSSVCGRYVIVKLALSDIPMQVFQQMFSKNTKDNDKLILGLTEEI